MTNEAHESLTLRGEVLKTRFDELRLQVARGIRDGDVERLTRPLFAARPHYWRLLGMQFRRPDVIEPVMGNWASFGVHHFDDVEWQDYEVYFISGTGQLGYFRRFIPDGRLIKLLGYPRQEDALWHWIGGLETLLGRRPEGGDEYPAYSINPA